MRTFFYMLSSFILLNTTLHSQIYFDNNVPPDEMVMDFFNSDSLAVSNIEFSDAPFSMAFFDAENSSLEVNAGIVFTTGLYYDINNPAAAFAGTNIGLEGSDIDIEMAGMGQSFDNIFLEFDFVSNVDRIFDFNYVFGSEEYPEFVGSGFNDAFLFLVNGPGIDGVYSNNAMNTAMIPYTSQPVTINGVNDSSNNEYYINNEASNDLVFDGHTTLLPASFEVLANETYHVKIIIADIGDGVFDSGIFLGYNSLGNPDSLVPPTNFSLMQNGNSIDILNESKYATGFQWDFGNGVTSLERYPEDVIYDTPGEYTVSLITTNYCCSNSYSTVVTIESSPPVITAEVSQDVSCFGGNNGAITLNTSGGNGPYEITSEPEILNFNQVSAGEYIITVIDQDGLQAQVEVVVIEPEEIVINETITSSDAGSNNGSIVIDVQGGVLPYSYVWSNGSVEKDLLNIPSGEYTVTITDANDCIKIRDYTVNELSVALQANVNVLQDVSCFGGDDGQANLSVIGGNGPYTYNFTPADISLAQLEAGNYGFQVVDQDGQEVSGEFTISEPDVIDISSTVIASTDQNNNGSIELEVSGGVEPYYYLWSNGEDTKEIVDLAPDEYTVTVTDDNGCIMIETMVIESVVGNSEIKLIEVELSPNPAKDLIKVFGIEKEIAKVSVYSINGLNSTIEINKTSDYLSIDISNLISGVFTVEIIDVEGNLYGGKFIKK